MYISGRDAKLSINQSLMISPDEVIKVILSMSVKVWKHSSLKNFSQSDPTTYTFSKSDWVMKIDGMYEMPYTMYYEGHGESVITSIEIDGRLICGELPTTTASTTTIISTIKTTSPPITTTASTTTIISTSKMTTKSSTSTNSSTLNPKTTAKATSSIPIKLSCDDKIKEDWVSGKFIERNKVVCSGLQSRTKIMRIF